MKFDGKPISAGLYFVATPIGAARDITLRALDLLAGCDLIAAEDTRTARKLMEIHGVPLGTRQVIAYHDHSGPRVRARVVEAIRQGRSVAYVAEAGTPLVADPGYALGRAVIAEGLPVHVAPGASAMLAALAVAGLPTDRFAFLGFLPAAKTQRQTALAALAGLDMTLVFYESPKRVGEMLGSMVQILGGTREAAVCRELTKRYEDVQRGTLADLAERYATDALRGEIVIVVGRPVAAMASEDDVRDALAAAMASMRMKDAATAVAGALGLPRRDVYQIALGLDVGNDRRTVKGDVFKPGQRVRPGDEAGSDPDKVSRADPNKVTPATEDKVTPANEDKVTPADKDKAARADKGKAAQADKDKAAQADKDKAAQADKDKAAQADKDKAAQTDKDKAAQADTVERTSADTTKDALSEKDDGGD